MQKKKIKKKKKKERKKCEPFIMESVDMSMSY